MGCGGHNNYGGCYSHNNNGGCHSHNNSGGCNNHGNYCPSHSGAILTGGALKAQTSYTAGSTVIKTDQINNLRDDIDVIRARWGLNTVFDSTSDKQQDDVVYMNDIRDLRNAVDEVLAGANWVHLINDKISGGNQITVEAIQELVNRVVTVNNTCGCNCNYGCTCNCNYSCTCNCNYSCTCNCNYSCVCNCNYYCVCNCAYGCTCNCNYACTCQCAYSDERLKENLISLNQEVGSYGFFKYSS